MTLPLLTTGQALDWLDRDEPTLIVAGAGLSVAPPTGAPKVALFLKATTDYLHDQCNFPSEPQELPDPDRPGHSTFQRYIDRLFPESCYGAIGEVFGSAEHLRMWGVLADEIAELPTEQQPRPNDAHRLVVDRAATHGWPVLTTNFDLFLERAAKEADIPFNHNLVPRLDQQVVARPVRGAMTLIKLHGTATDATNVRSTAADLSRCARIVQRLQVTPQPQRLLVLGYSGRDFDLFPWLAAQTFSSVLWVDTQFSDGHRANTLDNAHGWTGSAADLGTRLLGDRAGAPPVDAKATEKKFGSAATAAARDSIERLAAGRDAEAVAALAAVLESAGSHRDVIDLVTKRASRLHFERPDTRFQMLLTLTAAHTSIDEFASAKEQARNARRVALRMLSPQRLTRASIALTYAKTRDQWLNLPVAARTSSPTDNVRRLAPIVTVFLATIWCAVCGLPAIALSRRSKPVSTRTFRLACEYLEHWVRLTAFLESKHQSAPWLKLAVATRVLWSQIETQCQAVGYATGLLHVSRYTTRRAENPHAPDGAITRALMMGQTVALAIAYRDAAEALLPAVGTSDSGSRSPAAETAREYLRRANLYAEAAGCTSLQIKIRILQVQRGLERPMERHAAEQLVVGAAKGCSAIGRASGELVVALASTGGHDE